MLDTEERPRGRASRRPGTMAGVIVALAVLVVAGAVWVTRSGSGPSSSPAPFTPSAAPGSISPSVRTDNFDGPAGSAPSSSVWTLQTGGNGWGNGELECYTDSRDNSALDGAGHLVITARYDPGHVCSNGTTNDYTSARLSSQHKFTTEYGQLAIRAKLPSGSGVWPAFWALGDDHDSAGWPQSGEIDVVEGINDEPTVNAALHGPTYADPNSPYSVTGSYDTGAPLSDGFHTYAVTWSPTQFAFSFDGHVYRTIQKGEVQAAGTWVFDHPFYILVNLAVGGTFPGTPDASATWPQTYTIDWIRATT